MTNRSCERNGQFARLVIPHNKFHHAPPAHHYRCARFPRPPRHQRQVRRVAFFRLATRAILNARWASHLIADLKRRVTRETVIERFLSHSGMEMEPDHWRGPWADHCVSSQVMQQREERWGKLN